MNETDNSIEYWSELLANRLVEIRFIDMDELKAAIKIHIKSSLYHCLKIQLPEIYSKLNEVKLKYASLKGSNQHIQAEILLLKQQLKETNKLYAELDRENMNKEMHLFMKRNYNTALLEFFKFYNEKFPKPIVESESQLTPPALG